MRYLETRDIPVTDLTTFPGNPRRADIDVIRQSITANGQYRALVVRRHKTGRKTLHTILAGNHTYLALTAEGHNQARAEVIECTAAEADRIVLADNRTSELGTYNDRELLDLLDRVRIGQDTLAGTGFDLDSYDDLLARLDPALDELPAPDGEQNVRQLPSTADYAARYDGKATRSLVADFQNAVYIWLVDRLAEIRAARGFDSNADVLLSLIEDATGQAAPEVVVLDAAGA